MLIPSLASIWAISVPIGWFRHFLTEPKAVVAPLLGIAKLLVNTRAVRFSGI